MNAKPIDEMTVEDIALELARLHGYIDIQQADTGAHLVVRDGVVVERYTKRAWAVKYVLSLVPDWTGDADEALALCTDVRVRLWDHDGEEWFFLFDRDGVSFGYFDSPRPKWDVYRVDGDDALAMSKLALLALREMEVGA